MTKPLTRAEAILLMAQNLDKAVVSGQIANQRLRMRLNKEGVFQYENFGGMWHLVGGLDYWDDFQTIDEPEGDFAEVDAVIRDEFCDQGKFKRLSRAIVAVCERRCKK